VRFTRNFAENPRHIIPRQRCLEYQHRPYGLRTVEALTRSSRKKEDTMGRFGYVLMAVIGINLLFVSMAMAEEANPADLEVYFGNMIDQKIACCQKKATYRNSRYPAIRLEADRAWLKQAYYREYKNDLIEKMISNHVGTKSHQIDYYLIKSFYGTVMD
jgi:hypothetical protein